MAITAQTDFSDSGRQPLWLQRQYDDHQGIPVFLGKLSRQDRDFYAPQGEERFALQIYSKVPIPPEDLETLHEFLFGDTETAPFIEVYSYLPSDAFACVEHQRREIAHRKRLHDNADGSSDFLPPLIPKVRYNKPQHDFNSGFAFLFTSYSYREGDPEMRNELGTGPLWIRFNTEFPSQAQQLEITTRLSCSVHELRRAVNMGIEVYPEAYEVDVELRDQEYTDQSVHDLLGPLILQRPAGGVAIDFGVGEPLPAPTTLDSNQMMEILRNQQIADIQSVDPSTLHLTWGSGDKEVTVTNKLSSEECDLQYVVYVPFLANTPDSVQLETTARTFTAGIISYLASEKTVCFDFRVSDSLSCIAFLSNEVPVGALHSLDHGSRRERVLPLNNSDSWRGPMPFKFFAVVLDKPEFITEPGVLFLTVFQDLKETLNEGNVAQARRSAGLPEAARRLAMLSVEEGLGDKPKRLLSAEEHRSMLGVSEAEYSSLLSRVDQ